ncbi:MAG: hypothetical protein LC808_06175 [Actinobacteria bacterium]|nr:hypothetical protein [Actinomycetota bacterium]
MGRPHPKHPVWEVYDRLRTARLTYYYYAAKAASVSKKNRALEILLAVTVSSSAFAGLPAWKGGLGRTIWLVLSGIGALVAVAKPILKLTESLAVYEKVAARYRAFESELQGLGEAIGRSDIYDDSLRQRYNEISAAIRKSAEDEPVEPWDEALRQRLFEQIRRELPNESFFLPSS